MATKEYNEYLALSADVKSAEDFIKMFSVPGADGKLAKFEDITMVSRVRYNNGSATVIHTCPALDKFFVGMIKDNDVDLIERAMLYAAILLNKEKLEAEAEVRTEGIDPCNVGGSATAPSITNSIASRLVIGHVGTPINYPITVATPPAGTTYIYTAAPLPDGVTINSTTGVISGTPTTIGVTSVNVKVTNSASRQYDLAVINITVGAAAPVTPPAPSIPSAPAINGALSSSGQEGVAYSYTIAASNTSGTGITGLTYGATGLPTGLSIDTATGVISGTPGAGSAGSHAVTITVTTNGGTDSETLNLTITV